MVVQFIFRLRSLLSSALSRVSLAGASTRRIASRRKRIAFSSTERRMSSGASATIAWSKAGRLHGVAYARRGDHAAITHQNDVAQAKAPFELVDLRGERAGVAGIAVEHLDRDWPSLTVAEQPVDDLQAIGPVITAHMRGFGVKGGADHYTISACSYYVRSGGLSPLRDPRPFPVLVSNSHTVAVHHD